MPQLMPLLQTRPPSPGFSASRLLQTMIILALALALRAALATTPVEESRVLLGLREQASSDTNRKFISWTDDRDHCFWEGVYCTQAGRVDYLDLHDMGLTGSIPTAISELTQLELLAFDYNNLTGTIPPEISTLTALHTLHLNNAQLSGTIPPQISALTSLTSLSMGFNSLSGTIPPQISVLRDGLYLISLEDNQLTGSIPPQLSSCEELVDLYLSNNKLTGSIPKELSTLNLLNLFLDNNHLTGTIPLELSTMSLEELALQGNYMSGNLYRNVRELGWMNFEVLELQPQHVKAEDMPEPTREAHSGSSTPATKEDLDLNLFGGDTDPTADSQTPNSENGTATSVDTSGSFSVSPVGLVFCACLISMALLVN